MNEIDAAWENFWREFRAGEDAQCEDGSETEYMDLPARVEAFFAAQDGR